MAGYYRSYGAPTPVYPPESSYQGGQWEFVPHDPAPAPAPAPAPCAYSYGNRGEFYSRPGYYEPMRPMEPVPMSDPPPVMQREFLGVVRPGPPYDNPDIPRIITHHPVAGSRYPPKDGQVNYSSRAVHGHGYDAEDVMIYPEKKQLWRAVQAKKFVHEPPAPRKAGHHRHNGADNVVIYPAEKQMIYRAVPSKEAAYEPPEPRRASHHSHNVRPWPYPDHYAMAPSTHYGYPVAPPHVMMP